MANSPSEIEICMRCWRVRHWTGQRYTEWTRSPREMLPWSERDRERYVMCFRCIARLVDEVAAEKGLRSPAFAPKHNVPRKRPA